MIAVVFAEIELVLLAISASLLAIAFALLETSVALVEMLLELVLIEPRFEAIPLVLTAIFEVLAAILVKRLS